jgi:hypothetical protein
MGHHPIEITQDVASGNPKRVEARLVQGRVAHEIAMGVVAHGVHLAVDLDRQTPLQAREVGNVAAAGKLTPEAESIRTSSELLP